MGKKNKIKLQKSSHAMHNDQASLMLTEQEQKLLYSTRKHTQQNSEQANGPKRASNQPHDAEDQEDDQMGPIELSSLNHTSAEEITEFINKLIAKNKISSKNAFDIPLIHLEQMEDFRASLNDNTWKRLSSTLENDYKIYGYRVDATHTITYKMVESIARHEATNENTIDRTDFLAKPVQLKKGSNQNDLLESFIDNEFNENVNKNKLNVDYTKFIEKNQKLLNIGQIQSFFGYNPGLERTKRKFDQQGFRSLLLNNIELRNGCELKLDEHYYNENEERLKEQMEGNDTILGSEKMDENQFDEIFSRIQSNNPNQIVAESDENTQNIFTQIYELNVNEAQAQGDDCLEFERLYKIVSGEEKEEKRLRKKMQAIVEENKESQAKNVEKAEEVVNQEPILNNRENNLAKDELPEPINEEPNESINRQDFQDSNPLQTAQVDSKIQINIISNLPLKNIILPDENSSKIPKEETDHVLVNKNFQMKQLDINNLEQDSQSSQSQQPQKIQYTGKLKNIEEYIKIKESSRKQKKTKINIEDLDPQEIGKKLFNKKYTKKKPQKIKTQDLLQDSTSHKNQKIDFSKLKKQANDLKRSVIFKKSLTEQRIFNQTREKIKQRLQKRDQDRNDLKQAEIQKKRKGKKVSRLFDLPIYQFQKSDINFINPIEEIDPETSELEFSDIFKYHFPSFVFSSNQILEDIRQKKELKEKQIFQAEQNKRLEQGSHFGIIEQEPNILNEDPQNIVEEENELQNSDKVSPDISFICDDMTATKGNQVVIREAKEKVRKLMLKMFNDTKTRKNYGNSIKTKKLTFKGIYESYYRQNGYISPALCFLTVLHLANEHNMILEGKEDGSNFKIWFQQENQISEGYQQGQEDPNPIKIDIEDSFVSRESSSASSLKTQNNRILKDFSMSQQN